ncbi:MAG: hypothetical protein B7Z44_12020 [Caulobacter sp. 12-67-6]|nr:MAG: hypothetical protein B7Z44_12020 [Caulobacter sp. 12-67-6]OYX73565.1 MAG: hypothetical protein B7Y81_02300 [Caulobacter sp. 32-67-35]OYX93722.1 MAG: hypothetical protein B7Y78_07935 [Caulobacter sp. 35-67-4]
MPPIDVQRRRDQVLNRECFCITLDSQGLQAAIRAQLPAETGSESLVTNHPHLFAQAPVFLAREDLEAMLDVVGAIEAAAATSAYQDAVLTWAPAIAREDFGPRGAFMGYDFHLTDDGPKLIEVNTNAGGAFLNALLARAQTACCEEARVAARSAQSEEFEPAVWRMFMSEWESQRGPLPLRSVAIVDDRPEEQYLFPEFLLAQRFFERQGLRALIADPGELSLADGRLLCRGEPVDLVYNRLVDFSFGAPGHQVVHDAYRSGAVVLTPSPRNHALFGDKRNLTLLSDGVAASALGLTLKQQQSLSAIPRTVSVTAANVDELWSARKRYFFKPAGGHGGKAVYRGDKMTRSVWEQVQQGDYIAQELATPSQRRIRIDGEIKALKLDVRLYTFKGSPLLTASRVYQGQTTNFRTAGGGFAPVFVT